ncbi:MAG: hypothetical protein ACOC7M_03450 [Chloroflexota bacterium]
MEGTTFAFAIAALGLGALGFIFGAAAYSQVQKLSKEVEHLKSLVHGIEPRKEEPLE